MKTHPFHIAVCDDEAADRERIRKMAEEVCQAENNLIEGCCGKIY